MSTLWIVPDWSSIHASTVMARALTAGVVDSRASISAGQ
jgi:hypothetical protein